MSTTTHVESFLESRYVKFKQTADLLPLFEAPAGLLLSRGVLIVKTEYMSNGAVEAYILASGERFWGGCKTAESLNNLPVSVLTPSETNIESCRLY